MSINILAGSKCDHSFCINIFAKNIFHLFYYRSDGVFSVYSKVFIRCFSRCFNKVHHYTSPVSSHVHSTGSEHYSQILSSSREDSQIFARRRPPESKLRHADAAPRSTLRHSQSSASPRPSTSESNTLKSSKQEAPRFYSWQPNFKAFTYFILMESTKFSQQTPFIHHVLKITIKKQSHYNSKKVLSS